MILARAPTAWEGGGGWGWRCPPPGRPTHIDAKGVLLWTDILGTQVGLRRYFRMGFTDRRRLSWRESEVKRRLLDVMERSFDEVVRYAERTMVNKTDRGVVGFICWPRYRVASPR